MFALMLNYSFIFFCLGLLYFINAQMKDECPQGWNTSFELCQGCGRQVTQSFTKFMCLQAGYFIVYKRPDDNGRHNVICCKASKHRRRKRSLLKKKTPDRRSGDKSNVSSFAFGNPAMPRNPPKKKKRKNPSA